MIKFIIRGLYSYPCSRRRFDHRFPYVTLGTGDPAGFGELEASAEDVAACGSLRLG